MNVRKTDTMEVGERVGEKQDNRMDIASFGIFVCELRKEKGLTQKELAERLFVSNKAVSKWERGLSMPDISLLEPLSRELGVTIKELLHGERLPKETMTEAEIWQMAAEFMEISGPGSPRKVEINKKRMLLYIAMTLLAVGEALVLYLWGPFAGISIEDVSLDILILDILGVIMGLWFFCLIPERLPKVYDMLPLSYYRVSFFEISMAGVRFNNNNWSHILRAGRGWCVFVSCCWPGIYALVRLAVPMGVWWFARLPVILGLGLGGLFAPIMIAAKKYQSGKTF